MFSFVSRRYTKCRGDNKKVGVNKINKACKREERGY
jgi:hypothetical protein